ncbi:MAG: DegV family protein [Lachnospiraceae bacterium]|nr:DegV family protein [Lachnospiraceae bacterium]
MFKIITDNGADLPKEWLVENDVDCLYLSTILDGEVIAGKDKDLSAADFYKMLSDGAKPSTSQINPEQAKEYFDAHINDSDEFLYIGISTGLSGTVGSVRTGVAEVLESHPDKKIEVVDSLTASLGEGLVVWYAVKMRNEGKSLEETAKWLNDNVQHFLLAFTVDNLFDLWRGGRVSRTSAIVGTLASVKPFLIVDKEGKLAVPKKLRGRKKSLAYLVENLEEHKGQDYEGNRDMIMICHGNVPEDAAYVKQLLEEKFGYKNFLMSNVGPMIGTHTGASLVVLSFMGDERY